MALNVISFTVMLTAVVHSWRSAERVVRKNRAWTRAWRILVAVGVSLTIYGLTFPLGAIYALRSYKVPSRPGTPAT
jgi:hypothetical protein